MRNTCANCAHFAALAKECRAKPPMAFLVAGANGEPMNMGVFPPTKPENWCGEWRPAGPQGVN